MYRDILFTIFLLTPYEDLHFACRASRLTYDICQDPYLWLQKARRDLGISEEKWIETLKTGKLSPRLTYIKLLTESGRCTIGSELFTSPAEPFPPADLCLRQAYRSNNSRLIKYFRSTGLYNIYSAMIEAAFAGDLPTALRDYSELNESQFGGNPPRVEFVLLEAGLLDRPTIFNTFAQLSGYLEGPLETIHAQAEKQRIPFNRYLFNLLAMRSDLERDLGRYGHPETLARILPLFPDPYRIVSFALREKNRWVLKFLAIRVNLRAFIDRLLPIDARELEKYLPKISE